MSSSSTPLFGAGPSATTSSLGLFPTQSQGSGRDDKSGPNVYYLVFLGVLVILMLIAACLAYRAVRIRRRYRSATQLALARGDPIPGGETYWGLGGLAGWTTEGLDRLGNVDRELRRRGERDKKAKVKVPVMFEQDVYPSKMGGEASDLGSWEVWEEIEPVSIQSLRALDSPVQTQDASTNHPPTSPPVSHRTRPSHLFNFRQRSFLNNSGAAADQANITGESMSAKVEEIDRLLLPGEPVRVAIVIQMPHPNNSTSSGSGASASDSRRIRDRRSRQMAGGEEDDEQVGWEEGMELGVWEGSVGPLPKSADRYSSMSDRRDDYGKRMSSDSDIASVDQAGFSYTR